MIDILSAFDKRAVDCAGVLFQEMGNRLAWAKKLYDRALTIPSMDSFIELSASFSQVRMAIEAYVLALGLLHEVNVELGDRGGLKKGLRTIYPQGDQLISSVLFAWTYVPPNAPGREGFLELGGNASTDLMAVLADRSQLYRRDILTMYGRCSNALHMGRAKDWMEGRQPASLEAPLFEKAWPSLSMLSESQLIPFPNRELMVFHVRDASRKITRLVCHRWDEVLIIQAKEGHSIEALSPDLRVGSYNAQTH